MGVSALWVVIPATVLVTGTVAFVARAFRTGRRGPEPERDRPDAVRHKLGRTAEYLDGLPTSEPVVRQPFELGLAAMRACRWDEAVSHFQQAMGVTNGVHLVALLNLIGVCRYTQGRTDEALSKFAQSAGLAVGMQAKRGRAQALNNIGLIYRDSGELDRALPYLEESLALARELSDQWAIAILLGNTANVWHDRGDLGKALELHEQALAISRDLGDRWGVACELGSIGSVYLDRGELDKALKYDKESLAVSRSVGYRLGVVAGLASIANIHRQQGLVADALRYEEEALVIARKAGYSLGVAVDLGNIGLDLMLRKKHKEAVPRLAEALTILLSIGVADGPRQALTGLVRCEDKLGRKRVEALLEQSGLDDERIADLLDRIDQMRMKRPVPQDDRQLSLPELGRQSRP